MVNTPITGIPLPSSSSTDQVPADLLSAFTAAEKLFVGHFTSTTDRDTKITAPVKGMVCWCDTPGLFYEYNGAWRARVAGGTGALCKPVQLSNPSGGATKFAAPTGAGYYAMGQSPNIAVQANRIVYVEADVQWNNGGALAALGVRWERVRTDASGFDLQTAEQDCYIGGSGVPDTVVNIHHSFADQITAAGTYYWRLAAKTDQPGNTAGILAGTWSWLNVTDRGPIPTI